MHIRTSVSASMAACSQSKWGPSFEKITIPTITIALCADTLGYFREERIVLPAECNVGRGDTSFGSDDMADATAAAEPFRPPSSIANRVHGDSDEDDDDDAASDESDPEVPTFPAFSEQVRQAIARLGGSVFVKCNWHSAQDARWIMAGQTLRCADLTDVYQLLKASSKCKDDLLQETTDHAIHLRRWCEIHPGTEFRCYVRERRLLAISPRDWPQYHGYMAAQRNDIVNDIRTMFEEYIREKFELDDFCFDVVRESKDNVILVDFSPLDSTTTTDLQLAFTSAELDDLLATRRSLAPGDDDPEFRYMSEETGIQPSARVSDGIPKDVVDFYQSGAAEPEPNGDGARASLDDLLFRQLRGLGDGSE